MNQHMRIILFLQIDRRVKQFQTIYFITSANYKNDKILSKRLYKDIALFVVNFILPTETDWDEFFAKDVGELKLLEAGKNWWDSRIIGDIKTDEQRKRVKIPLSEG